MAAAGFPPPPDDFRLKVTCLLNLPEVAERAQARGITRSLAAMEILGKRLHGAIVAVGNAPTTLLGLCGLWEKPCYPPRPRHRYARGASSMLGSQRDCC